MRLVLGHSAADPTSDDLGKRDHLHAAMRVHLDDLERPPAVKTVDESVVVVVPRRDRSLELRAQQFTVDVEHHRFRPPMDTPDPALEVRRLPRQQREEDLRKAALLFHARLAGRLRCETTE
jgi:hypothetical protein